MRRTRLAHLAALVLAPSALLLAGCGGSGAEPAAVSAAPEVGSVLAYVWDRRPLLVQVDALTLQQRGPALELGEPPIATWAAAPAGDRVVLGSGDGCRLLFADLRTMRRLSTLDLGPKGYVAGLAWLGPGRVLAALSGERIEVVLVDPESARVLAGHVLPGMVRQAAVSPHGLVLLVSPPDGIGRATLAIATAAGVRTAQLPLEAGVSPPAVLEPGLAVSSDGRRAVIVPGGATALEVDLRTLAVTEHELSQPVSLLGRLRSWLEPAAHAKGPLEGPVRSASWLGRDTVAVAGWNHRPLGERSMVSEAAGVELIDTRNWSVRTLAGAASATAVAGDTLLAFGGTQGPAGSRGTGLLGFAPDGRERFHAFGDRYVGEVTAAGRYAYVSQQSETEQRIEVVDVTSGRVVTTVRRRTHVQVLPLGPGDGAGPLG